MSAAELAEMLGVSVRTVRRLDSAGKLPRTRRLGGSVKWSRTEIEAWIRAGCVDRKEWDEISAADE